MIKREEAHEELHFGTRLDYMSFNELHMGIEAIYDSIGSCGECKYGVADRVDTTLCVNSDSVCYHNIHENTWFCADFERKTNED